LKVKASDKKSDIARDEFEFPTYDKSINASKAKVIIQIKPTETRLYGNKVVDFSKVKSDAVVLESAADDSDVAFEGG
jgi:hypothetical protein